MPIFCSDELHTLSTPPRRLDLATSATAPATWAGWDGCGNHGQGLQKRRGGRPSEEGQHTALHEAAVGLVVEQFSTRQGRVAWGASQAGGGWIAYAPLVPGTGALGDQAGVVRSLTGLLGSRRCR
jgi:hypothetical protein